MVKGRIIAHKDGFGFVVPDEGKDDLYLSPRQMRSVMNGDRVLASVVGVDNRGRKEGVIREVLEHNQQLCANSTPKIWILGVLASLSAPSPPNPKYQISILYRALGLKSALRFAREKWYCGLSAKPQIPNFHFSQHSWPTSAAFGRKCCEK